MLHKNLSPRFSLKLKKSDPVDHYGLMQQLAWGSNGCSSKCPSSLQAAHCSRWLLDPRDGHCLSVIIKLDLLVSNSRNLLLPVLYKLEI